MSSQPMNSKERRNGLRRGLGNVIAVISVAAVALLVWEAVVWWWELPRALLPTPRACVAAGIEHREALFRAIIATGIAAVAGLLMATVIGSAISLVFSQSERLRAAFFPYVVLLQTVPIVAIAPLLIIWSGYTFRTVVIVTVIVCLFPIVNSVTAGLTRIERSAGELFDLYRVGRLRRLLKLQIPSAISDLIVGVKTSSGLAVIGAIVAEFFVGNGTDYDGLGTLMTGWQAMVKTDALIAALFFSAVLGLSLFGATHFIGKVFLRRWTIV
ncbi:putative aliphatic sulfonates transport permease protein SsuC [Rubripirellula amarantea]|uniref:Putative aliphatic sulfonates transport permease protein SsuC n=1 Tax=Rubripirellula amarantea TaxID=2527999 RepID=A0A5C5WQA6_9BACT|nr:ABC transporter permease subunit [Rubripirellula amarantea]TWT52455.1 putative aliphatic sulfonates transport permease protein SsuC [Rubripirellula amarantea]